MKKIKIQPEITGNRPAEKNNRMFHCPPVSNNAFSFLVMIISIKPKKLNISKSPVLFSFIQAVKD